MERRIEPEPALGGKLRAHVDVGDEKAVVKDLAVALQSQERTDGALGAVGDEEPVAMQGVLAILRGDADHYAIASRRHADDLVPPAQLRVGQLVNALNQELLDVVLLQVDERRTMVTLFGQEIELVHLLVMEEDAAHTPAHALLHQALATAQPVENLERALRPADRARTDAHRVVLVE